ncbi:hypothetical protein [Flavisphingomonas formosensis]|uniref:hypothetical protein n=1 Tax=Flavisphingomonas formosensis TaxID=861534 RepID=UPI0018E0538D|nr:hypothetical protein [Sphingomonas formosensis]
MSLDSSNDHIVRSWHEWEIEGRERCVILVVETDVEMRPDEPGYDGAKLEEVRAAAVAASRRTASAVDRIRIIPAR